MERITNVFMKVLTAIVQKITEYSGEDIKLSTLKTIASDSNLSLG